MPANEEENRSAQPPTMVDQNVEAIMALQSAEAKAMTRHQRAVERMVVVMTYPAFLFGIIAVITLWIGVNVGMRVSGQAPWDKPPFGWLQTSITVLSLIMTSVIVITQSRQGKVAERSAHLDLQINLLVDQKVAKVIQLLEEMRKDSPTLRNRRDEMAEEMQIPFDPSLVAAVIAEKMNLAGSELETAVEILEDEAPADHPDE